VGRVIFQFKGIRSSEFFEHPAGAPGVWSGPTSFCRWRSGAGKQTVETADGDAMKQVRGARYKRVILSAFQRASSDVIADLGRQCGGMRLHHEISAAFETPDEVHEYCEALDLVFATATERTAGVNVEELGAFTSWQATETIGRMNGPLV
jgi:hypothetical protein